MASQINLLYAGAKEILHRKGYNVLFRVIADESDERCRAYAQINRVEGGNLATAFYAGKLSAPSLNLYLVENFGELFKYSALFPVNGGEGAIMEAGSLSQDFPLAAVGDRAEGFQKDMLVHERFLSLAIKDYAGFDYPEGGAWSRGIKSMQNVPFQLQGNRVKYVFPTEKPFYYVIEELHEDTVAVLKNDYGLFVAPSEHVLEGKTDQKGWVVSNWSGAQYLLPPNSIVLQNKIIDLSKEMVTLPRRERASPPAPLKETSREGSVTSIVSEAGTVEELCGQIMAGAQKFFEKPDYNSFRNAFVGKKIIKRFGELARESGTADLGTKRHSKITEVRNWFEKTDGDWQDLWNTVQTLCGSDIARMYVLVNLNSQIEERSGKPRFKKAAE